jgi:hypothetical protein
MNKNKNSVDSVLLKPSVNICAQAKFYTTSRAVHEGQTMIFQCISSALPDLVIPEIMRDLVHFTPCAGICVQTSATVQVLHIDSSNSGNASAYQNERMTPCCTAERV